MWRDRERSDLYTPSLRFQPFFRVSAPNRLLRAKQFIIMLLHSVAGNLNIRDAQALFRAVLFILFMDDSGQWHASTAAGR